MRCGRGRGGSSDGGSSCAGTACEDAARLRGLFGCHDLCCPGLGDGSRTFSRVTGRLFGVACGRLAGLFFS